MIPSGLYIVALRNVEPISVNAHDARIADRCIRVSCLNRKVGKAANLAARARSYAQRLSAHNVIFTPVACIEAFAAAERIVLTRLKPWRMRRTTGRINGWSESSPTR